MPAALTAVLLLAACGGGGQAAEDARALDGFAKIDALAPGTTEVGRTRYEGGMMGINGSLAHIVVVLASPLPFDKQLKAYQQHHPEFDLGPNNLATATSREMRGDIADPPGAIYVTATAYPPHLSDGKPLAAAPPGTRSWLAVHLQVR